MTALPPAGLFAGLCDDAAVFPPGNLPLERAVPAHVRHGQAAYADVVGAFVLAAKDLGALSALLDESGAPLPVASLPLSLTVPVTGLAAALEAVAATPAVRLVGVEVAVPEGVAAKEVTPVLEAVPTDVEVYVEIPRDERRDPLLAALSGTRYAAKFRTGGVRAELYPDEKELAEAVLAAVRAGVPFKATAGLHHALRNTDPETGFEQHGFLNLLTAVAAARAGADVDRLVALLAERDPERVAAGVRALGPEVRETFRSFGTCSIAEPVDELVGLGLLPHDHTTEGIS
ncbi:hypothetical protein AB3X52_12875 [Nocardioides sp. DS6]|uniref:Uncharacterized protein n=1 Tax=Nocardioides eburneus TaxID=3231482 RepID=A0ABV3T011_9ACTN